MTDAERPYLLLAIVVALATIALAVLGIAGGVGSWWVLGVAIGGIGAMRLYWAALRERRQAQDLTELDEGQRR